MKNKSPKEFAEELMQTFRPYVNGYVGSSFLTNFEYPDRIEKQAVKVSKLCINQMREFGAKNNLREELTYLNMTETELNKILKQL